LNSEKKLLLLDTSSLSAVYLCERGWQVTAIDCLPTLLDRCRALAALAGTTAPTLLCWNVEQMLRENQSLHDRLGSQKFDLIHVARYLHRPLYESLRKHLLRPGGFIVYSTFARGCEAFGKPKNPLHILQPRELLDVFGGADEFLVHEYRESRIEDLRPVQSICSQRLPPGMTPQMLLDEQRRSALVASTQSQHESD
jgi:SAM-dependent methyltransferase